MGSSQDLLKLQKENELEITTPLECPLEIVQEFLEWRRRIKPLFVMLAKKPSTDLETAICCEENDDFTSPLFQDKVLLRSNCKILYDKVNQAFKEKEVEARELWASVQKMVKELEDKNEPELFFSIGESNFFKSLSEIKTQYLVRTTERTQRISSFIIELRKEIAQIWEKCRITEEEKSAFKEFYVDDFSEENLITHKKELGKWQVYYSKNQEILQKIKKREEMWEKLRELEAKSEDPNRFVNRGGALLQDQNLHAYIKKHLPKLETELICLANLFEKEHGQKMKIDGIEIPVMIEDTWKSFEEEKALRKQTRRGFSSTCAITTNNNNIGSSGPTPNHNVPLRARHSIMPNLSTGKIAEKRPGQSGITRRDPSPHKFARYGSQELITPRTTPRRN